MVQVVVMDTERAKTQKNRPSKQANAVSRQAETAGSPANPPIRDHHVDVAIIGGGTIGLTLGISLAQSGIQVAVVDRELPLQRADEPFDGRSFAIAYGSKGILDGIGVWPLVADDAQPILEIRVADNSAPSFLHYDHREVGSDPFGWIVESRTLRRALLNRAASLPNLRHVAPVAVEKTERTAERCSVLLADGRRILAPLIVGADGRSSHLRREAGIRTIDWRYGQDAITLTVAHERPHLGIAVEHFLPSGPFAILPMADDAEGRHRSSIVWTERVAIAKQMMKLDEAQFSMQLTRRFGDFLGQVQPIGPRWCHALSVSYAHRITDRRLALIGDAAHSIHPIAGQGLNLGIRGTAVLTQLVIENCRLGLDPGAPDLLARYQQRRRFDTIALTTVTDCLNRLFSNDIGPLKRIRDVSAWRWSALVP